jgi:prepilin-type N-terminal cleavage/methylation domain-containing protein
MKNKLHAQKKGFSLIEVMVFITVMSIFFVTASAIATNTLKSMHLNEHRIIATRYAEELIEWIKAEKETDWNKFVNHITGLPASGSGYCATFNALDIVWPSLSCASMPTGLTPAIYTRQATFTYDPVSGKVNVAVVVYWQEGGVQYSVPLSSVLTQWQ